MINSSIWLFVIINHVYNNNEHKLFFIAAILYMCFREVTLLKML